MPIRARRVFAAIGRSDLAENPDYATNRERIRHRDEIDRLIADWTLHTDERRHEFNGRGTHVSL